MTMRKIPSPILAAVHDTAKGLHKAGVMDQVTLREFNPLCLPTVSPLQPEKTKKSSAKSQKFTQPVGPLNERQSPPN
jgi:DNA-binding transcriptional regulator YiaG